jgi:hypothetical protein
MAREKGAKLIIVCNTETVADFDMYASQIKGFISGGRLSVEKPKPSNNAGLFLVSPEAAEKIMATTTDKLKKAAAQKILSKNALKKIKTIFYSIQNWRTAVKIIKTENVLGYLEGTDKKDELVVITAHYDHIGKKKKWRR